MSQKPTLDAHFDPSRIERDSYEKWEKSGYFSPKGNGDTYSIAIPPPNVTGTLHLGHAFQHTIMDTLIRYQRMNGSSTLWQTGTDHAGIATQMVVTEQLKNEGKSLEDIGRDAFIDRVWNWRNRAGGTITDQMRRVGSSVDWENERFTMDEAYSRAVIEVFVRLHEDGLIYKGKRLVNWDPVMETALSDLEVINAEEDGHLWHLRYPLADGVRCSDGKDYVIVATTRPETMLGDTAVAVHPDDSRYRDLIGKSVQLPLADRTIPIIADEYVDMEFGTGCLKITPAHDFNDNEIGQRHDLEVINIFTRQAKINDNAPEKYHGMARFDAREVIVQDLEELALLERVEDYKVQIPRGDRSNAILEPWLTDQWFVDIQPLAEPAIEAVKDGRIEFRPKRWENVYFNWMSDIKDWCISRQLWWGHRIPAWYDQDGNTYVGRNEDEVRSKHQLDQALELNQDSDVLETWFSSALWTFATLGWPEQTQRLNKYHPTSVLVTGHDIIFFWVARMIMMTLRFTEEVPFKTVYVTGLVRDRFGQKMTKTKGNGLDPLDVIDGIKLEDLIAKRTENLTQQSMTEEISRSTEKEYPKGIPSYGTDALRFTLCALASPSSNYNFDLQQVEGYHFFCNKIWNAAKFVLNNIEEDYRFDPGENSIADRWIRSRLSHLIDELREAISTYRFDLFAHHVYQFAWHEFCDWYLEFTKPVLFNELKNSPTYRAAQATLLQVFETLMRLLHPVMPYISEEVWLRIAPYCNENSATIMLCEYPTASDYDKDSEAEDAIQWTQQVITAIRSLKNEREIPPGTEVEIFIEGGTEKDQSIEESTRSLLSRLSKVSNVHWLSGSERVAGSASLVDHLKLLLPFANEEERQQAESRLQVNITKLEQDLSKVQKKLANASFVERAPAEIVAKERERQATIQSQIATLNEQLQLLDG